MAEGFDMICAEAILSLKTIYKKLKLIAITPCKNQEVKWKEEQQERYHKILKKCDKVICLSHFYTPNCMNERNEYMVKKSSELIALFSGKPSGTRNTINFAETQSCKITIIDLNRYRF